MAIVGRARTATGAGVLATALLVLLFGNQAFTEWVVRHTDGNTVWGWFLRTLSWPAWTVRSTIPIRDLLAQDLRAVLPVQSPPSRTGPVESIERLSDRVEESAS